MKKRTYFAALLPFLILAGMFEILPVFTIIVKSFMPESGDPGFTLQNYINIFSKPLYPIFPAFPWHFPSLFCWAMPGLSQSWDGTWELTPLLIFHSTQSGA